MNYEGICQTWMQMKTDESNERRSKSYGYSSSIAAYFGIQDVEK